MRRFRGNLYLQKGAVGGAFRMIPHKMPPLTELGLPPSVPELTKLPARPRAGAPARPAAARSTTLAAMIDKINRERHEHIVTVEDPIEFVHEHKSCLVNQREVFADTHSFAQSLKHVLRQDPDIVLIGEMRDLETIEAALVVAETGHLVFSTLHTNSAVQTINRIIDVFPPHQQAAGARAAVAGAPGRDLAAADPAPRRPRPRPRRRGDDPEPRHPQPHPRGEGPPDLLADAGRPERSSACRR